MGRKKVLLAGVALGLFGELVAEPAQHWWPVPVALAEGEGGEADGGDGDGDGGDSDGGDSDGGDSDGDGGDSDGGDSDGGDSDGDGGDSDGGDNDGDGPDGEEDRDDGDDDDREDDDEDDDDNRDDDDEDEDEDEDEEDDDDDDEVTTTNPIAEFLTNLFSDDERGGDGNRDFISDEIVAFAQPDLTTTERGLLATRGLTVISEHSLGSLSATVVRLSVPRGLTAQGAVDLARSLAPDVVFDVHDLFSGSGIGCSDCWGAELVRFERLPSDACRRGGPVAILDTDVDTGHPALAGASIAARSFLQQGQSGVRDGHGTAVAALLVGQSAPRAEPLAPSNHLLAASVFRRVGDGTRADTVAIVRALDWALANRARVIAMSFEGAGNAPLHQAIRIAAGRANLVGAAGNGGRSAAPAFPAAFPEVIAVTAIDARRRAFRSGNRGAYVEIAAPGVGVVSAAPDGGWKAWTGTSFAVPFVAAALLRARAETQGDPVAARALLAERATDLGARGRDDVYGYGLLQIETSRCW